MSFFGEILCMWWQGPQLQSVPFPEEATTCRAAKKRPSVHELSVNFKKTIYMPITSSKKKIHLNIHNIKCKSYIKYLGIYLDEHLQWEPQIQNVNNKLAMNVGIINKLRHYRDFHMLKQLYYTLA